MYNSVSILFILFLSYSFSPNFKATATHAYNIVFIGLRAPV